MSDKEVHDLLPANLASLESKVDAIHGLLAGNGKIGAIAKVNIMWTWSKRGLLALGVGVVGGGSGYGVTQYPVIDFLKGLLGVG